MNETDPEAGELSGGAWRSPHEPINDTVWEITSVPHTFPFQKVAVCVGVVLILALVAIFVFRRVTLH